MDSPAVEKAYACLRFARTAASDEQRAAWDNLARLWLNLANERSLMTPCEQAIEAQRLRELEALAVERHDSLRSVQPAASERIDSIAIERIVQARPAAAF